MAGHRVIPIAAASPLIRERKRQGPKGRKPTDQALAEVVLQLVQVLDQQVALARGGD